MSIQQTPRRAVMSISDRLDEIAARCDAATEGPWIVNGPGEDWAVVSSGSDSVFHAYSAHGICEGCECGDGAAHVAIGIEDAEFIAASRTDAPAMLAALRAVLNACSTYEKTQAIYGIEMGQREIIRVVRAEIAAALGEES